MKKGFFTVFESIEGTSIITVIILIEITLTVPLKYNLTILLMITINNDDNY